MYPHHFPVPSFFTFSLFTYFSSSRTEVSKSQHECHYQRDSCFRNDPLVPRNHVYICFLGHCQWNQRHTCTQLRHSDFFFSKYITILAITLNRLLVFIYLVTTPQNILLVRYHYDQVGSLTIWQYEWGSGTRCQCASKVKSWEGYNQKWFCFYNTQIIIILSEKIT